MRDLTALAGFIAARETMPFAYGPNDCVTFAFGGIEIQTGVNRLAHIPIWHDEKTARRALAVRGGIINAVSDLVRAIPVSMAMRGDIGAVVHEDTYSIVIIEGVTVVGPGPAGLFHLSRSRLTHAWSID